MPPPRAKSLTPRSAPRGLVNWRLVALGLAPTLLALGLGAASLAAVTPDSAKPAPGGELARLVDQPTIPAPGGPSPPVSSSPGNRPDPNGGPSGVFSAGRSAEPSPGPSDATGRENVGGMVRGRDRDMGGGAPSDGSLLIVAGDGFAGWHSLNDTIMGGRSQGQCQSGSAGLVMTAEVVAEGGGFVSCRSPLFSPPLDLSTHAGLQLDLEGDGRRYKLAIACSDGLAGLTELIPGGLRWVAEFGTEAQGLTRVWIPFSQLRPSVRAKPVGLPLRFDPARITRLQLLHSRFGDDGGVNSGFRAGPLRLAIHSIRALP